MRASHVYRLAFSVPPLAITLPLTLAVYAAVSTIYGTYVALQTAVLVATDILICRQLRTARRSTALALTYGLLSLATAWATRAASSAAIAGILLAYGLAGTWYALARTVVALALSVNPLHLASVATAVAILLTATAIASRAGDHKLALALARTWLDDYTLLEEYARTKGCTSDEYVAVICYCTVDGQCFRIVASSLHYGPLRRSAGALLPYLLSQRGTIVLHAPVSHEKNPCSYHDVGAILAATQLEAVKACGLNGGHLVLAREEAYSNGFRAVAFPAPLPLIVIDRPGVGIDDLPAVGPRRAILVDAHNEEAKSLSTAIPVPELVQGLKLHSVRASSCRVGYAETVVRNYEDLGLCMPWIRVVTVECNGRRWSLVSLPSNNAEHGLRAMVEEATKPLARTIVTTLDDHACVGAKPGQPLLRARNVPELVNAISSAIASSVSNLREVSGTSAALVHGRVCTWCKLHEAVKKLGDVWWVAYLVAAIPLTPLVLQLTLQLLRLVMGR
jgi:predicted neutral ceramidase superfamily lipid hydrolase